MKPGPTMMINSLWLLPTLILLPCGWFAAARHFQRKIVVLQSLLQSARQTTADHANQARRQIGQLQAELAARPPMPPAARDKRADPAPAEDTVAALAQAEPDTVFAATAMMSDGFPQTMVMRPGSRR